MHRTTHDYILVGHARQWSGLGRSQGSPPKPAPSCNRRGVAYRVGGRSATDGRGSRAGWATGLKRWVLAAATGSPTFAPTATNKANPPKADRDEPGREHDNSQREAGHFFLGRAQPRDADREPEIRREHQPALPRTRQAPAPAVSLRREPVVGSVGGVWLGCFSQFAAD